MHDIPHKKAVIWITTAVIVIVAAVFVLLEMFTANTVATPLGGDETEADGSNIPAVWQFGYISGFSAGFGGMTYNAAALTALRMLPPPPMPDPLGRPPAPVVKGIYISAYRAGMPEHMEPIFEMFSRTRLNAAVIDVKNDVGRVCFKNEIPIADEYGISSNYIHDIRALTARLKDEGIFPIARVVAFKDNGLYPVRPDFYIKDENGDIWRDSGGSAWLNPYNRDVWEYLFAICEGAVNAGFLEIQFDYIRFDTSSRLDTADFGDTGGLSRTEIITEFTAAAAQYVKDLGAYVSADVYGTIIGSAVDAGIVGQDYRAMAAHLDFICPMVYPSHYAPGTFGIANPDAAPYEVILAAMRLSNSVLADVENPAIVRPWLQAFTASYLPEFIRYTPLELKAQIDAVYDAGLNEWLMWNASSRYDEEAFR